MNYVSQWESFAGKPYVKPTNKPSGLAIRNTVSQAQDTLYRLKLGRENQGFIRAIERLFGGENYPQSLGELCIELAQNGLGFDNARLFRYHKLNITNKIRRDIQELRRVMWHKHTDPKKELFEQRLERMIRLVQFA